jgi:hypothetical protein
MTRTRRPPPHPETTGETLAVTLGDRRQQLRPVFYQAPFSGMRLLWPPFGALADRVLDFLTR